VRRIRLQRSVGEGQFASDRSGAARRIACRHLPKSGQPFAAAVVGALSVSAKVRRAHWSFRGLRDIRQENNAGR